MLGIKILSSCDVLMVCLNLTRCSRVVHLYTGDRMCGYVLSVIKIILPRVNLVPARLAFLQLRSLIFCGKILQPMVSYRRLLVQTGTTRGYSDILDAKLELLYQLPC